ncbi:hypothetical protein GLOIN_2v1867592 [Rhizophagus irregularis DAOM 181602=DAOM 197198]|uniref:Uncharacterized protein n=1 Tax=Rhizophagus irregularis (strain DAOM 181602 / DAOM 197198 / MUCL 43194) TaxID=747089 RepID=A0A2P4QX22_RHIID|nr:hypothetical protein GLOIN_2v1867592 [Rhizophagus irregularis DAOM 181602=DAOM 197198]POG82162.1 hypothetical protein GLOIN_2v1867592 [Rhizophagus irregularis DAOM 181602=DAOM 197198]|eukprot:XP_025189028.1 hypothetical protein GLOIN_2v1867592 [Rhizophagus irregularis DAOM 181602=DAOM 197198]
MSEDTNTDRSSTSIDQILELTNEIQPALKIGIRELPHKETLEETGKGSSCWEYFDDMNEIFGNRENVRPDYLSSSISSESDINSDVKIKPSTSQQKRLEIDIQKLEIERNEREAKLKIEEEKLKWEKEKFEKEQEFKFKLELERINKEFELKIKEYNFKN